MTDMTTHDAAGLLPCPFCGGDAEPCSNVAPGHYPMHWILCRACHASPGDRKTEAEAIAAWNTRSQVPPEPVGEDYGPGSPWSEGYNSGFAAGSREILSADVEPSPDLITQIARLLAADPVCGGRVASGTIEAIAGLCSRNLGKEQQP